jgi:hypothetical protein
MEGTGSGVGGGEECSILGQVLDGCLSSRDEAKVQGRDLQGVFESQEISRVWPLNISRQPSANVAVRAISEVIEQRFDAAVDTLGEFRLGEALVLHEGE